MKIEEACKSWLFDEYCKSAISRQDLLSIFLRMWLDKKYRGEKLTNISDGKKALRVFERFCKGLLKDRKIRAQKWSSKGFRYITINSKPGENIEKILSATYPIGYIGYISAIKHYNLIGNISNSIYFVTVDRNTWKRVCLKNIYDRFPELKKNKDLFQELFENIDIEDLIATYPVEETIDLSQVVIINQKRLSPEEEWNNVRVESLPYLYIDILRNPKYCGGLGQVLQIYTSIDNKVFEEVIEILDKDSRSTNIDMARFGFIFEKIFQLENHIFLKWKEEQLFKRGGTRKLVSYLPFESTYDEDWNISVNYDLAKPYASSSSI